MQYKSGESVVELAARIQPAAATCDFTAVGRSPASSLHLLDQQRGGLESII